MNYWLELAATLTVYFSLAGAGAVFFVCLRYFTNTLRRPWLPLLRIRRITWNGFDVGLAFVALIILRPLVDLVLRSLGFFEWLYGPRPGLSTAESENPWRDRELLWSTALAAPLLIAAIVLTLWYWRHTRPAELGLTKVRAARSAVVGYLAWFILTPLVIGLFTILILLTPKELIEPHAIERVAEQNLWTSEWLVLLIATVLLIPLAEELLFRGLLLPWQLRGGWDAQATMAFCTLLVAARLGGGGEHSAYNPGPLLFVLVMLPGIFFVPFLKRRREPEMQPSMPRPENAATESTSANGPAEIRESKIGAFFRHALDDYGEPGVAIFTNGLFFAALHSDAWPSPIPLFLLGGTLAWVTYRTSSLIAAVTLHSLFNAVAAVSLVLTEAWK